MITFISILLIFIGACIVSYAIWDDGDTALTTLFGIAFVIFGIGGIIPDRPKAIDVYRNKTTLEITYRDNIPVDTVVVFKNE